LTSPKSVVKVKGTMVATVNICSDACIVDAAVKATTPFVLQQTLIPKTFKSRHIFLETSNVGVSVTNADEYAA